VTLRILLDPQWLKWGKALSEPLVDSVKEKRANICKGLDGKPLFRALYDIYTVTLNELKAILTVSA
jgi:hypothetical protein